MKQVILSLFTAYQFSSGQTPPAIFAPIPQPRPGQLSTTAVPLPPGVIPIPGLVTDPPAAPQATDPPTHVDPTVPATQTSAPQTTAPPAATTQPATTAAAVPIIPEIPVVEPPAFPPPTVSPPASVTPSTPSTPSTPVIPSTPSTPSTPVIPSVPLPSPAPVAPQPPTAPAAPVAPEGYIFGAFEQLCPVPDPHRDFVCRSPSDLGSDLLPGQSPGFLKCERSYDCCACSALLCNDCNTLSVGPSGAYGVKDIVVNGRDAELGGAQIKCQSTESCLHSVMNTQTVREIECLGDMGCMGATIRVFDPVLPGFKLDCSGTASCDGLTLEVVIPGPPPGYQCNPEAPSETKRINGLECNGQESCQNAVISVINNGCDPVMIDDLKCFGSDACTGTTFNLEGDVQLGNCDLGPSGHSATGIDKCFEGLLQLKCPDPRSCAGSVKTLVNPTQSFQLHCGNTASCENAQFTLEFNLLGSEVTSIEGFVFSSEDSGKGATVTVRNQQFNGKTVDIEKIECKARNSCAGTTFVLGHDVSIWEMQCGPNSCGGCRVKIDATDEGVPCDPKQIALPTPKPTLPPVPPPTIPPVANPSPRPSIPQWLPAV